MLFLTSDSAEAVNTKFMQAKNIVDLYKSHPSVLETSIQLDQSTDQALHLKGIAGSAFVAITASLFKLRKHSIVLILNDREEASYYFDGLSTLGLEKDIFFLPSSYKRSAQYEQLDQENIILRTNVLSKLADRKHAILVTFPEALSERIATSTEITEKTLTITKGDKLSIDFVNDVLFEYGFELVDFVEEPGQYSIRGSIIDIFSYANQDPFRVDFFGDEVDSIRNFDIENQLSIRTHDTVAIMPNMHEAMDASQAINLFSSLKEDTLVACTDFGFLGDRVDTIFEGTLHQKQGEMTEEQVERLLVRSNELYSELKKRKKIEFGIRKFYADAYQVNFSIKPQPQFQKNFQLFAQDMKINTANGLTNYILSSSEKQIERLQAIFDDGDFDVQFTPLNFTLHEGFIDADLHSAFYTDHQVFERYHRFKSKTKKSSKAALTLKELNKLHPGDYVVHIDHGVGKFAGLVKTDVNGKKQEAVRLVYRDNDSLLVNIHSLHRISKFKGKDGGEPKMNKLGTAAWANLKKKTKSKVKDIAKDLIALYAQRKDQKGFAFSPDSYLQQELEASFIYEDTPDQLKTTEVVKADMEKEMPMDRLVCGDVGFGKTEIAIRAAFKAATDGKQVAVLVPTTILALQHYKTFSERLKEFPVNISYISRLRKTSEIKRTLLDTKEGKIDIVIGTHRLVGKDIEFKDLGLLIIDEEQKFGVTVKEKLKRMKVNVDTLTLTATPIPRTLQFSLMGARDLSAIQTPPPNRYPINTEVHGFNENIIKEAIEYEIDRNGQAFFINNRVQNIFEVEAMINRLCPGVKTVVGHGQMDGKKLEEIMLDFINGSYDVLIATTIIESGLDVPNANTIIVNNAHNFGLSDLHQLRGRVGRSNRKAFCYLLAPPMNTMSAEGRRRLNAIEEYSDLGSGFSIAMQDLDIRGAGNLLGGEQSGFVGDIGIETYHRILNEAILELKQGEFAGVFEDEKKDDSHSKAFTKVAFLNDCVIDTDLEVLFPEGYITSTSERMTIYRELDNLETEEQISTFKVQLEDRFGKIPQEAENIFDLVALRRKAIPLGIEKVILKRNKFICHFISNPESLFYQSPLFGELMLWLQKHPNEFRMKQQNDRLSLVRDQVGDLKEAMSLVDKIVTGVNA